MENIRNMKEQVTIELRQAVEAAPQNQIMQKAPFSPYTPGNPSKSHSRVQTVIPAQTGDCEIWLS